MGGWCTLASLSLLAREYQFHHVLIRDVAYGRLPLTTRMSLHARYAERGVGRDDVVARAHQLWEATNPAVAEAVWESGAQYKELRQQAFDAQLAAGRQLESWNQYEQAEVAYSRAVELATDAAQRGHALAEQGRVMARQGKGDDAWTARLAAIDAYAHAETDAPAVLYADMLEIATLNWGYFHQVPSDDDIKRLLDDGIQVAESGADDVSLARLRMESAAYFGDASGVGDVMAKLDSPDAVRFADAAHRSAQVLMWSGDFTRSLQIYGRVFDDLLPRGGLINEPEAFIWYGLDAFLAGDLELAASLVKRAEADLAKGRSAHTSSHVLGLTALNSIGRGDWQELARIADEMEQLLVVNPDNAFCLIGGAAVGYGGVGRIIAGVPLPNDLAAEAARMIEESRAGPGKLGDAARGDARRRGGRRKGLRGLRTRASTIRSGRCLGRPPSHARHHCRDARAMGEAGRSTGTPRSVRPGRQPTGRRRRFGSSRGTSRRG